MNTRYLINNGCLFKFILKVGVEESIVNAPLVLQSKNTKNAKSEVRFKQLICGVFTIDSSTPTLRINKKNRGDELI
jgi:hypothetical protein